VAFIERLKLSTTKCDGMCPFALLAIRDARLVSVLVTALLLVALGIGRGLIGQRSLIRTTVETLTVAAAAAAAGIIIGKIIA
jgi:vacuolar iron transporter family protein